jgi:large subunit ribosomal protein L33
MAKNKGSRINIILECTECKTNNEKRSVGVSHYSTTKNRRNNSTRLNLKKYCPFCNKHVFHKETK